MFTLGVLAIALGIAFGSAALFGVSFALGAFVAGVVISESELSQQAAEDSLPLQDAFAVLFFVSVGMLFDPSIVVREPLAVLAVLLVIVVGHGRVGGAITPVLAQEKLPFVVVERDPPRYESLRKRGVPALFGDAAEASLLEAAGVRKATLLIIATPDSFRARRVLELARAANPAIEVVIRTHSDAETTHLREQGVGYVVMGERELARTMLHHVLRRFGVPPERAQLLVDDPASAELAAESERR